METNPRKMYRTLLFAPGSRPELLAKAQLGDADAIIFDLEDSVPLNAKVEARQNIAAVLAQGLSKPMYLRISNPRAGDFMADLSVLKGNSIRGTELQSRIHSAVAPLRDNATEGTARL